MESFDDERTDHPSVRRPQLGRHLRQEGSAAGESEGASGTCRSRRIRRSEQADRSKGRFHRQVAASASTRRECLNAGFARTDCIGSRSCSSPAVKRCFAARSAWRLSHDSRPPSSDSPSSPPELRCPNSPSAASQPIAARPTSPSPTSSARTSSTSPSSSGSVRSIRPMPIVGNTLRLEYPVLLCVTIVVSRRRSRPRDRPMGRCASCSPPTSHSRSTSVRLVRRQATDPRSRRP